MARSRVEVFEAIRWDACREGLSIRGPADRYGVHRRTVRQALAAAVPPGAQDAGAAGAAAGFRSRGWINAMLREDLDAPRKQQHTARRVLARLVDEHADAPAVEGLTYSAVRDYVRLRRPQI